MTTPSTQSLFQAPPNGCYIQTVIAYFTTLTHVEGPQCSLASVLLYYVTPLHIPLILPSLALSRCLCEHVSVIIKIDSVSSKICCSYNHTWTQQCRFLIHKALLIPVIKALDHLSSFLTAISSALWIEPAQRWQLDMMPWVAFSKSTCVIDSFQVLPPHLFLNDKKWPFSI